MADRITYERRYHINCNEGRNGFNTAASYVRLVRSMLVHEDNWTHRVVTKKNYNGIYINKASTHDRGKSTTLINIHVSSPSHSLPNLITSVLLLPGHESAPRQSICRHLRWICLFSTASTRSSPLITFIIEIKLKSIALFLYEWIYLITIWILVDNLFSVCSTIFLLSPQDLIFTLCNYVFSHITNKQIQNWDQVTQSECM